MAEAAALEEAASARLEEQRQWNATLAERQKASSKIDTRSRVLNRGSAGCEGVFFLELVRFVFFGNLFAVFFNLKKIYISTLLAASLLLTLIVFIAKKNPEGNFT